MVLVIIYEMNLDFINTSSCTISDLGYVVYCENFKEKAVVLPSWPNSSVSVLLYWHNKLMLLILNRLFMDDCF